MPTFYFDTSAVVKRYKTEEGTEFVDQLFSLLEKSDRAATSFLTVLEFISAGRRLLKAGEITTEDFESMLGNFLTDVEKHFILRALDNSIIADAIDKVVKHALRSADSVQLATAVEVGSLLKEAGEEFIFVAGDDELCKAARAERLDVINPREKDALRKLKQFSK
ncbi:MAG: type II toxin-antitoxin system VapC family toxin [Candidatus Bipolaricaulia bacterium]